MRGGSILSGELGLISLFDLGQLLMLNGATGVLKLQRESAKAYFYFVNGQVVNAVDDERNEGEEAAYRLFTWKSGEYEFRPEAPSISQAIASSTEGLMMEAARRMDERGPEERGPEETSGEADRLSKRANSLDSLRQAFQSVANQARPIPDANDPQGSPFELLQDASDALLLRRGHAPRVRLAGQWRNAGSQPIDAGAFDQLRTRFTEGAHSRPEGGAAPWVATHENGRDYEVAHLTGEHEALFIRAAGAAPPDANALDGPHDLWRGVLAAPAGLLLVTGPDAESADRLFHACVAETARTQRGVMVLAADHGRWAHAEGAGALVRAAGDDDPVRRSLAPEIAAFDLARTPASAAALHGAARVIATVIAPGPADALARWCARVERRWGDGIEGVIAGAPVDIVHATGPRAADGRTPFGVVRLAFDGAPSAPIPAPAEAPPAAAARPKTAPKAAAKAAPAAAAAPPEAPETSPAPPLDPMAALSAEISRTLGKAA